jgi:hypothetical protein
LDQVGDELWPGGQLLKRHDSGDDDGRSTTNFTLGVGEHLEDALLHVRDHVWGNRLVMVLDGVLELDARKATQMCRRSGHVAEHDEKVAAKVWVVALSLLEHLQCLHMLLVLRRVRAGAQQETYLVQLLLIRCPRHRASVRAPDT